MIGVTVAELIRRTAERLAAPELVSEDAQMEARELIAHALEVLPKDLPARASEVLDARTHDVFLGLLARRLAPEPTGYIVGAIEVGGVRFKVDRRGFIPRLDLPVIVEAALRGVPVDTSGFALDLACGIGAAGILVGLARPGLHVDLADVSTEAIELARENAAVLLGARASGYAGDLFEPLPADRRGRYAAITANPPWVPDGTLLPQEVIDHEPAVSFFGGPDGLDVVRRIIEELPAWLAPGGIYAQECDPSQVEKVLGLLERAGLREPRGHADNEGVRRVVSARKA
jgi:release factor glutamine methyltransferase